MTDQSSGSTSTTPAGCYNDPMGQADALRYWDGVAWTQHLAKIGQRSDGGVHRSPALISIEVRVVSAR
jgi:hypothetical protein